jgi:uncharacterized protein DUF4242
MPIFLDRHMVDLSAEEVAKLHVKDLEVQDKYGVKFLTYWYDAERQTAFCLVNAPDKETADKVHAEAHGHVANEMIAVNLSAVEAFLGRIQATLGKSDADRRFSLPRHHVHRHGRFDRDDGATRRYDGRGTPQGSRRDHSAVFGTPSRLRGKTLGRRHYGIVCRCTGFGRVCN